MAYDPSHNPHPQHPQQQPPYPQQQYGPQQQPVYYQQPPVYQQPHGTIVTKHRMGAGGHSIHATLTLFTCGFWSPIWFLAWLMKRGKSVTRY